MTGPRRHPRASVPDDHPASKLPRRRLAQLRPGMVVPGVITRMVRGGVLVDILLDSGEPAFVPLSEIPAKSMPKVRELLEKGTLQQVRLVQLDRANGTATASLQGLLGVEVEAEPEGEPNGAPRPSQYVTRRGPRPPEPEPPPPPPAPPAPPPKLSASERARRQQEEILRRLRGA